MRKEGWEERYLAEIERHATLPAQYGVSDCFVFAMDVAQACVDRELDYHRDYSTEAGALKALHAEGHNDVADAFKSFFEEIPPSFAGRADVGVILWDGAPCGVVVVGDEVIGKHPTKGTVRLPRSALVRAFRVE